jgi:hypothetical protein
MENQTWENSKWIGYKRRNTSIRRPKAFLRQTWNSKRAFLFNTKSASSIVLFSEHRGSDCLDMLQTQVSCGFNANTSLCYASLTEIECLPPSERSSSDTGISALGHKSSLLNCQNLCLSQKKLSVFLNRKVMNRKFSEQAKETTWLSLMVLARRKGVDLVKLLEASAKFTRKRVYNNFWRAGQCNEFLATVKNISSRWYSNFLCSYG